MKNLFKIYLSLVSLVAIIGITISFGSLSTMVFKFFIISDSEYLEHKNMYNNTELKCEDEIYYDTNKKSSVRKYQTEKEIQDCNKKRSISKIQNINDRYYLLKEGIITSIVWLFSFLILFLLHYIKFCKYKAE